MEQFWWNTVVEQWNSVCGTVEQGKWNSGGVVEQWNSVGGVVE